MPLAYRESLTPATLLLTGAVLCGIVAMHTIVGPLGTNATLGLFRRVAYWALCGVLCTFVCYSQGIVTLYLARHRSPSETTLALAATALFLAVPCASITFVTYRLFHSAYPPQEELVGIYRACAVQLIGVFMLWNYVLRRRIGRSLASGADAVAAAGDNLRQRSEDRA